jgi:hypothetical protein
MFLGMPAHRAVTEFAAELMEELRQWHGPMAHVSIQRERMLVQVSYPSGGHGDVWLWQYRGVAPWTDFDGIVHTSEVLTNSADSFYQLRSGRSIIPVEYLFPANVTTWQGKKILIPRDPHSFTRNEYGDDFMIEYRNRFQCIVGFCTARLCVREGDAERCAVRTRPAYTHCCRSVSHKRTGKLCNQAGPGRGAVPDCRVAAPGRAHERFAGDATRLRASAAAPPLPRSNSTGSTLREERRVAPSVRTHGEWCRSRSQLSSCSFTLVWRWCTLHRHVLSAFVRRSPNTAPVTVMQEQVTASAVVALVPCTTIRLRACVQDDATRSSDVEAIQCSEVAL